mmetsp:Transcript_157927/g.506527  ORF Transcript_157927/g.506527 Transcript_157927/m.506527 type:complete len:232 (+) Transcript_157927:341-1036(+)
MSTLTASKSLRCRTLILSSSSMLALQASMDFSRSLISLSVRSMSSAKFPISPWSAPSAWAMSLASFVASCSASSASCNAGAASAAAIVCVRRSIFCLASSNSFSAALISWAAWPEPSSAICSRIISASTSVVSSSIPGSARRSSGMTTPRFISMRIAASCRLATATSKGVLPAASLSSRRARFLARRSMASALPPTAALCTAVCFTQSRASKSAYPLISFVITAVWPRAAA